MIILSYTWLLHDIVTNRVYRIDFGAHRFPAGFRGGTVSTRTRESTSERPLTTTCGKIASPVLSTPLVSHHGQSNRMKLLMRRCIVVTRSRTKKIDIPKNLSEHTIETMRRDDRP